MEVVVTTGAIRRAKLQSNRHHQQTNTLLITGRMPFLSPNQQRKNTEWKVITFHGLVHPKLTWRSSNLFFDKWMYLVTFGRVAKPLISPLTLLPHSYISTKCSHIQLFPTQLSTIRRALRQQLSNPNMVILTQSPWRWNQNSYISHAKLQSHRHHQQTNIQLFTGRMSFLSPNWQCQRTERKGVTPIHYMYGSGVSSLSFRHDWVEDRRIDIALFTWTNPGKDHYPGENLETKTWTQHYTNLEDLCITHQLLRRIRRVVAVAAEYLWQNNRNMQ